MGLHTQALTTSPSLFRHISQMANDIKTAGCRSSMSFNILTNCIKSIAHATYCKVTPLSLFPCLLCMRGCSTLSYSSLTSIRTFKETDEGGYEARGIGDDTRLESKTSQMRNDGNRHYNDQLGSTDTTWTDYQMCVPTSDTAM